MKMKRKPESQIVPSDPKKAKDEKASNPKLIYQERLWNTGKVKLLSDTATKPKDDLPFLQALIQDGDNYPGLDLNYRREDDSEPALPPLGFMLAGWACLTLPDLPLSYLIRILVNAIKYHDKTIPLDLNAGWGIHLKDKGVDFDVGETMAYQIAELAKKSISDSSKPFEALLARPELLEEVDWAPTFIVYKSSESQECNHTLADTFNELFNKDFEKYAPLVSQLTPKTLQNLKNGLIKDGLKYAEGETDVLFPYVELLLQSKEPVSTSSAAEKIDELRSSSFYKIFALLKKGHSAEIQAKLFFYCIRTMPHLDVTLLEELNWQEAGTTKRIIEDHREKDICKQAIELFVNFFNENPDEYTALLRRCPPIVIKNIQSAMTTKYEASSLYSCIKILLRAADRPAPADAKGLRRSPSVSTSSQSMFPADAIKDKTEVATLSSENPSRMLIFR